MERMSCYDEDDSQSRVSLDRMQLGALEVSPNNLLCLHSAHTNWFIQVRRKDGALAEGD